MFLALMKMCFEEHSIRFLPKVETAFTRTKERKNNNEDDDDLFSFPGPLLGARLVRLKRGERFCPGRRV
jgi:hypothetical protein